MRKKNSVVLLSLLGGFSVAIMPVAVPAADAWFGLDMPEKREQRSNRHRAAYQSPDFTPLSLRLASTEDPYIDIDGREVLQYAADIIAITNAERPAGEKFWGRIAGSEAERATAEYMADNFRKFGLTEVRTEPVIGASQWWPRDWSVSLIG